MAVPMEHRRAGQHRIVELQEGVKLSLLHNGEAYSVFTVEVGPNICSESAGHDGEELRLVLSGEVTFRVGKQECTVATGGTLRHTSSINHGFRTNGSPATFLTVALTRPDYLGKLFRGVNEGEVADGG
jgi:quercetin dioxygenase-like cupin family protein